MRKYPKIKNVFKREENGRSFIKKFTCPEFEYLKNNDWFGTEKVDGTNIRLIWDGEKSYIRGKQDESQIPVFLYEKLMQIKDTIDFSAAFESNDVVLYGEGFGHRINKGYSDLGKYTDFVLFDVQINGTFLPFKAVQHIAQELKLRCVPMVFTGTLLQAIKFAETGFKSNFGKEEAEGIVVKPVNEFLARNNDRIIVKLKTKDLRKALWEGYDGL